MEEPVEVAAVEKSQENPLVTSGVAKEKTSSENSEYDSVDSYSDEEQPVIKARSRASHSESEGSVILEREEGDGQESVPQKKVDDDEDKKNPQYIPKRGTFYEHDDRTAEDNLENQEETEADKADKDGKKKIWQDKKEKWTHDRFNDQEQAPKSRSELIAIYGYDIRNEDGPPRARRRRRYGRGPNKYTRNWEDEEAYVKPPTTRPPRVKKQNHQKDKNAEEFPPLDGGNNNSRARTKSRSSDSNQEDNQDYKENNENEAQNRTVDKQDFKRNKPIEQPNKSVKQVSDITHDSQSSQSDQSSNKPNQQLPRIGTGRVAKPKKEIKDSDYIGFTSKTRQQRGVRSENQKVLPPRKKDGDFIQSQNFTNKNSNHSQIAEMMEKEISQLNIQDGGYKGSKNNNQNRQGSVPPRLQNAEQKGSKRYSSMRQRSLPETNTPPTPANFSFYPNDYNSTAPPPATQQPLLPTPLAPPNALVPPQAPVSAAPPPLLQTAFPPPAAFAGPPPPQAYLQAPPPTFIAAPPAQPQIVSYVAQTQPPFVPGYQGQFNAVTQPTDLYQPQGITYYSADQQIVQRQVPLKRPKAAIPIVAPNDFLENKDGAQSQREEMNLSLSEVQEVHE